MKNIILLFYIGCIFSCCKSPKNENISPISPEVKEMFLKHEVGTKWVYKDSFSNRYDTIELVSKRQINTFSEGDDCNGTEGHDLEYKPTISRDFKIELATNGRVNDFVTMWPKQLSTGGGAGGINWGYDHNEMKWDNVIHDTFITKKGTHYHALEGWSTGNYYYAMFITEEGIIYYRSDNDINEPNGGVFYLVNILKP